MGCGRFLKLSRKSRNLEGQETVRPFSKHKVPTSPTRRGTADAAIRALEGEMAQAAAKMEFERCPSPIPPRNSAVSCEWAAHGVTARTSHTG